jgi:hypothetical protein
VRCRNRDWRGSCAVSDLFVREESWQECTKIKGKGLGASPDEIKAFTESCPPIRAYEKVMSFFDPRAIPVRQGIPRECRQRLDPSIFCLCWSQLAHFQIVF